VTDTHWQPPQSGNPTAQGWTPGPPAALGQPAPPEAPKPPGRSRMARIVGVTAVVCALLGAVAGSITGIAVTRDDKPAAAPPTTPPIPPPQFVEAQTRDLCTRFVAAFAIYPKSDQNGLQLMPVVNYAESALRDNPVARPDIRKPISDWVQLARDWVTVMGNEVPRGYITYPSNWTGKPLNDASMQAISLCRTGP
jgi:hypothetical protein